MSGPGAALAVARRSSGEEEPVRKRDPRSERLIGGRVRRRVRRTGGTFLLLLFVGANPAYTCPINCLLNHHADRIEQADHHGERVTDPMCHHGPQVTAPEAPAERALSPQEPAAVPATLPAAVGRVLVAAAVGAPPELTLHAPPSPPPRA